MEPINYIQYNFHIMCENKIRKHLNWNSYWGQESSSSSRHTLMMGRSRTLVLVLIFTDRTRPLASGMVSITLPSIHDPLGAVESTIITISPVWMFSSYFFVAPATIANILGSTPSKTSQPCIELVSIGAWGTCQTCERPLVAGRV